MPLELSTKLGRYEIRSKIGEGGMGEVYLAQDTKLDRKVALKILPTNVAAKQDRMRRFIREAKAAAAIDHPNIAQIHEIDECDGTHFIVMEFVDGVTLRKKIHEERTDLAKLLRYLQHVAEALSKAHAAGIVHRDLKPDNIMVTRDGHAKILDFGLAKLNEAREDAETRGQGDETPTMIATSPGPPVSPSPRLPVSPSARPRDPEPLSTPGVVMGTIGYLSPEQAKGNAQEIDQRSDIFSFGCILFEAITKQKPFESDSIVKALHKLIYEAPPSITDLNSSSPLDLQRVIGRCLAKDPDERYQSIREVAIELKAVRRKMQGADTTAPPPAKATSLEQGRKTDGASRFVRHVSRRLILFGLALVALILLGVGLSRYLRAPDRRAPIDSIAVLPFENRSREAETDYLSDGLTESLMYRLSQLPNLKVSPTSLVFRYKGKQIDAVKVGKELGVSAVLVGRINQHGDNLMISAELVNVRDNTLLWGEQYDRKMSDLLATQRQIAREIVDNLKLRVSGGEQALTKHYTENNEAYQLYLRGRFYWNKRSEEGLRKSLEYYQQAIEKDSGFALAYSGLADSYILLGAPDASGGMSPAEALPKAKTAALKALAIDDTLAEAHSSLAHAKYYDREWATTEQEYKRAIELNPNYPTAPSWYAVYLMSLGRFDEALVQIKRAQELDPLSLPINMTLGWVLLTARRPDESVQQLRKTLEMDPNFILAHHRLGMAYEQQAKYDEAIAEAKEVVTLTADKPFGIASLARAYALAGKLTEARAKLVELQEISKERYVSPAVVAAIYEALGNKDQAFAWLERAQKEHDGILVRLNVDPRFDRLRSDPRFAELVKRAGLPEQ